MESSNNIPTLPTRQKVKQNSLILSITILIIGLVVGSGIGYAVTYSEFNNILTNFQGHLGIFSDSDINTQTYLLDDNLSLA